MRLRSLYLLKSLEELANLPEGKFLINTINSHSYNIARSDPQFKNALYAGDFLIPDGVGVVKALKFLKGERIDRITGWDLYVFEMSRIEERFAGTGRRGKVFFLGSNNDVLGKIQKRAAVEYPDIDTYAYSPPYRPEFSEEESLLMLQRINKVQPDLLWIGMTAPKQEKWVFENYDKLEVVCHIGTIGAVFDYYAGTVKRAPLSWQRFGFEWLFRLLMEPRRLWVRYLIGNVRFIFYVLQEKFASGFGD